MVNPRRKNGLILRKTYYGDFAGPGSIIGGIFDQDVVAVIPVGSLSLLTPTPGTEQEKAHLIRRQWVRLLQQITEKSTSEQRAQTILNQFEHWFDLETAAQITDDVFADLVGVLPQTIAKVRNRVNRSEI